MKPHPDGTFIVRSAADSSFDVQRDISIRAVWTVFAAKIVAKDEVNDVAVLSIDDRPFDTPAPFSIHIGKADIKPHYKVADIESSLPEPGETIALAGFPLGQPYPITQEGHVASIAFDLPLPEFGKNTIEILLSIVANPGNSGGPVFNSKGKVIGLLEGGLPSRPQHDPAQAVSGIAVVVPAEYLKRLMKTVQ